MSTAVRVSVWILGVLVLASASVAVLALMQKQTLQGQNQGLQHQITDDQSKLADLTAQTKKLQDATDQLSSKITQTQQEKAQIQSIYNDLKQKSDDLQSQLSQTSSDRDDWKNRVETVTKERDVLMQQYKNRPTKIVYKDRIVKSPNTLGTTTFPTSAPMVDVTSGQGDQYWANVLRQKAALQVELQQEKSVLDQAALQVVQLKKQNSDLQLEVGQLNNEKDEVIQKIKYGQDLADNLSVDLARSRNDQKAVGDRADRLKQENLQLQDQIRDLSSTKLELEKTVARLTDDKDAMQKKLVETESVIQSRIDDIWKIKESLDKKLSENTSTTSSQGSMELPPIIVNAPNGQSQQVTTMPQATQAVSNSGPGPSSGAGKTQGNVISINESNNFAIVDLGQENSSVSIGSALKVFNSTGQVATLEVIQVRRDICAADIKDKTGELKVGDIAKLN